MKKSLLIILASLFLSLTACSASSEKSESETPSEETPIERPNTESATTPRDTVSNTELPDIAPGETLPTKSRWVRFSPQDTALVCQKLYDDNDTVQGFFPWGINYDTVLQWIVDTGNKTAEDVSKDSTEGQLQQQFLCTGSRRKHYGKMGGNEGQQYIRPCGQ